MDGLSRKGFLATAGAGLSAAALAVGCGGEEDTEQRDERRARTAADLAIVRHLLGIERIAAAFWEAVLERSGLAEPGVLDLAIGLARNERAHVEVLERYERRLGGAVRETAVPDVEQIIAAGPGEILRTGAGLANLAAAAHLGQLNRIQDRNLLASVLAIHSVEGRQAAALNRRAGDRTGVIPDGAFAQPLTMGQVSARLAAFAA